MQRIELMAPCHFGLESVLKKEIIDLGYDVSLVEDGRVTFIGDDEAVCRANIGLRTAERVLIKVASFHAETFEELYQGTKAVEWEEYLPKDARFWVRHSPDGIVLQLDDGECMCIQIVSIGLWTVQ